MKAQSSRTELHDSALVEAQNGTPQSAGPVTRLDTFNVFVQNAGHSIEQKLLKTKLNRTVMVRKHSQHLLKYPKVSGW